MELILAVKIFNRTIFRSSLFTTRVPDTNDTSATQTTRARQERDKNDTTAIRVRHERHQCDTIDTTATQVRHERHECDTSATQTTRVWHEWKILILIKARVKTYFHTPILAIWRMKNCKGRNNLFLRTPFWKRLNVSKKCITKWTLPRQKLYKIVTH